MFMIIIEYLYIIILLLINYKLVVYFNKIIKEYLCKI